MKALLLILLILTLFAQAVSVWTMLALYKDTNAVRLDPLELGLYPHAPAKIPGLHRVVFFGDSRALSWPAPELAGMEFLNRGIGQQSSEQIRLRFSEHLQPLQADTVILQLCINDLKTIPLFPKRRDAIVGHCKQNLQELVNRARAGGSQVILSTVFPIGAVPIERQFVWSGEVAVAIREVNAFMDSLKGPGVTVLDSFKVLEGQPDRIRPEYSRDLLHLNAAGYAALNQALVAHLTTSPN